MKKTSVFILSIVLLFSCKKDPKCSKDVSSISATYKITAYTYKQTPTSPEQDYYSILFPDACDRDNTIAFSTNSTYVTADAGIACSPPTTDNGTWSLSGDNMIIDGDQSAIEVFDCKTLVISTSDFLATGDKLKITLVKL
jgi:hypothetical protein